LIHAPIEIPPGGYISVVRFPIISRLSLPNVSGTWLHEEGGTGCARRALAANSCEGAPIGRQTEAGSVHWKRGETVRDSIAVAKSDDHGTTTIATVKVVYLLAVTAAVFAAPVFVASRGGWLIILGLLALQLVILLTCRVGLSDIVRPVWRLKWLFIFLIAAYGLLPGEDGSSAGTALAWHIPIVGWSIPINLDGLARAGLMCLQIATMLLASSVVRLTGTGRDLVKGLESFRLPALFVYSLEHTLGLLAGTSRRGGGGGRGGGVGTGGGDGNRASQAGFLAIVKRLLRGDVGAFVQSIRGDVDRAGEQLAGETGRNLSGQMAHDVAIVSGIALTMATLKIVKILPGIPFASGHKTLLLFPLYILASRLTYSRWGGTAAGAVMGVIGFLQGDGRFGILEMLKHLAPGVVIDLAQPWVSRLPGWALGYCLLGLAAAIARTTTEFSLVAMLGARAEIYIFPMAKLVPNLVAGFLSGFTTLFVLRAFDRSMPRQEESSAEPDGSIGDASGDRVETRTRPRTADAASRVPSPYPLQGE